MTFSHAIGARTVWAEGRGESLEGQRAIAHVIINRVHDGRWGANTAAVCWAKGQFDCWRREDPNMAAMALLADDDPLLLAIAEIFEAAADGRDPDPTGGATHYYNPDVVPEPVLVRGIPGKVAAAEFAGKFGHQLFYRKVP